MKKKIIIINNERPTKKFCKSHLTRIINRGKTGTDEMQIAPFDKEGFYQSLLDLIEKSKSFSQLIKNIHLINDTFLYPATAISLIILDKNKKPAKVYNADTSEHLKKYTIKNTNRSIKDWDINNPESLGYHLLNKNPGFNIYNFPDTTGSYIKSFIRPKNNYTSILSEPNKKKRYKARLKSVIEFSKIKNLNLLQKELNETGSQSTICSAILAPLVFNKKTEGALFIGLDIFHAYSLRDTVILKDENIVDIQQFVFAISTAIKSIKKTNREI